MWLMSLRDELLRAGLVSSDKAKKLDSDGRKHDYQRKKGKALTPEEEAQRTQARQQAEADAAHKREQDRQLNLAREAEKQRREHIARAHQLIEAHRINDPAAEIAYNFQDGNRIRTIRVTSPQRKALAMGRLAIVRGDRREFDFALAPREIAHKLAEFVPDRVLLLHPESSDVDSDDEWGDWE
ncbi:MAG: DUF2058 domain-containing protein [Candidatus Competibacteraceae bacterium]|nr:DUF2058 domain-containing protein [Candidatus Competibacteraceae bacterium]